VSGPRGEPPDDDELDEDGPGEAGTPDEDDVPPPRTRKRASSIGQSIGGVLFGFEQQVWRNVPPPHELVHHARPDDPVPAGDGGFMTLEIPDPLPPSRESPAGDPAVPEPSVRELAAQETVALRIIEPMATVDVMALVARALPVVGARIAAAGLAVDGPPYVRYHDWGGETADLEIGFPVAGDATATGATALAAAAPGGEPGRSSLPGGRCVVAVHVGPYHDLPATWGRLMTWIWDRDLEPAGPTWESYIDNPDLVNPAALRTEVIRPIRT
jgi:effector-binding domain-containing protein